MFSDRLTHVTRFALESYVFLTKNKIQLKLEEYKYLDVLNYMCNSCRVTFFTTIYGEHVLKRD